MTTLPRKLNDLTRAELIQKVLESEAALNEFQESSRELEKALEDELQDLDEQNSSISKILQHTRSELTTARRHNHDLGKELDSLQDILRAKDEEISLLRQKIVNIEISNDSMESQDRIMNSKYQLQRSFNNELLEKLAILEDEVERSRRSNSEKALYITNYQNQIRELNAKVANLEKRNLDLLAYDGDTSILSIGEMLKSTPPPNKIRDCSTSYSSPSMKKSDSLQKLKSLTRDIESFLGGYNIKNNKNGGSDQVSILKSPSTTQLSARADSTATRRDQSNKRLSYSRRISDLPSIDGSPSSARRIRELG
ncbi:uncharacterized protein LODBEIA_P09340 [Lodderomyces beijingensis]|uniref:NUDE domain-containing protein n=1 Tax=Lodderomyces beijingensis TaxID=1775926 RepID=A0ABP0ZHS6_9ASCO